MSNYPLIVHCHLNWNWVWQRPQQLLSRLAQRHPVLFVEMHPPTEDLATPTYTWRETETPGVSVLSTQFPLSLWSDGAFVDRERCRLVKEAIERHGEGRFENPVQWFYDPMAVSAFAGQMNERAIVYDCMDELSQFKNAPREITERERILLEQADVVFTGGRKLLESKSQYNPNTHFYGCGVDAEHFGKAASPETRRADLIANLPSPIFGYIGVIDERLDYELLGWLAKERPQWQFLMVGPVCKVDEKDLPRAANIHWLGGRPYAELPHYSCAFDVALMPFALNDATAYINPTKTLEYLAAHLPVVSTPVADVVSNFSSCVSIARSGPEFINACERALAEHDNEMKQQGLALVAANSWESIVESMEQHVNEAIQHRAFTAELEYLNA